MNSLTRYFGTIVLFALMLISAGCLEESAGTEDSSFSQGGSSQDTPPDDSGNTPPQASQNTPPAVSLSSPVTGSEHTQGNPISVTAKVSDSDGSVASVEFFANGKKVGADSVAPFSVDWTPVTEGSYTLTAKATDDAGAGTTSAGVGITVTDVSDNVQPKVSLSSPAPGSVFVLGDTVPLSAEASDSDGSVTSVEFFANGVSVGLDTAAPYGVDWTPGATGSYTLKALATDDTGSSGTSAGVNVTATTGSSGSPPDTGTGPGTVSEEWSPPVPPTGGPTVSKSVDMSWKDALSQIPGGGTLIIEPGHHITTADDWYFFSNWEYLVIKGKIDASGNRPLLEHVPRADGKVANTWINWGGTNGNLWIQDVRFKGAGSNLLAAGSGSESPNSQKVVLDNVEMSYAGHHIIMFSFEWTGRLKGDARLNPVNDELWIRDSSFHHSGATHVLYVDRIAKLVAINSQFYSPASIAGHAFKAIARQIVVDGNEISNAMLNGDVDTDTSHYSSSSAYKPTEKYLGAVPVSLVAGQSGVFRNNRVTHRTDAKHNTGGYCVAQQVRHDIHALEVPDPKNLSGTFYNPNFWHDVKNGGLDNLDNPGLWVTRFIDNEYILTGDSKDMASQMVYYNGGTYPLEVGIPYTPLPNIPGEWVERSRAVVSGDRVRGFTRTGRFLYNATSPVSAVVQNPSLNPTEGTADNPGGQRFVILTEPVEF